MAPRAATEAPDDVEALRSSLGIVQAQNVALRQLLAIHDRLGALVLQGADTASITRVLAELIGRRVLLLDALLQVVAMHGGIETSASASVEGGWAPSQDYVRAVLGALERERRPLRVPPMADLGVDAAVVLAPVAVGEAILGYLAILAGAEQAVSEELELPMVQSEELELQIVQHAATVYALSMMRERMAAEVARQLKDELFEGLLLGRTQDEQVARERAMRLGYRPETTYRVLVLVARDADCVPDQERPETAPHREERPGPVARHDERPGLVVRSDDWPEAAVRRDQRPETVVRRDQRPETVARRRRLLESLAELCTRRAPSAFAALREDELVVLLPEADDPVALGRLALQQAGALLPAWELTAGVGGKCASASAIARSYAQARRAVETGRRFGRQGDVVTFEDLGVYRLLFHVTDPDELHGFVDQVLGALLEYDQRHNADLVRTLATFLEHNGNVQATARELSLHVNSVAYRLQRVQAIAGLDLEQAEDRLLAQVALKIVAAQ